MKIRLLLTKLYLSDRKIITGSVLREHCRTLKLDYRATIRYLLRNKYLHRILRGIFYRPSIAERKLRALSLDYHEAIAEGLRLKGVKNWYWGLETALRLNAFTHEFFTTDYLVNDTIFRAKAITILGHTIKFVKVKKSLFDFGILTNTTRYSNPEKTVLDIIYLRRYEGWNDDTIRMTISELIPSCSHRKLLLYAKRYNKALEEFVRSL